MVPIHHGPKYFQGCFLLEENPVSLLFLCGLTDQQSSQHMRLLFVCGQRFRKVIASRHATSVKQELGLSANIPLVLPLLFCREMKPIFVKSMFSQGSPHCQEGMFLILKVEAWLIGVAVITGVHHHAQLDFQFLFIFKESQIYLKLFYPERYCDILHRFRHILF